MHRLTRRLMADGRHGGRHVRVTSRGHDGRRLKQFRKRAHRCPNRGWPGRGIDPWASASSTADDCPPRGSPAGRAGSLPRTSASPDSACSAGRSPPSTDSMASSYPVERPRSWAELVASEGAVDTAVLTPRCGIEASRRSVSRPVGRRCGRWRCESSSTRCVTRHGSRCDCCGVTSCGNRPAPPRGDLPGCWAVHCDGLPVAGTARVASRLSMCTVSREGSDGADGAVGVVHHDCLPTRRGAGPGRCLG